MVAASLKVNEVADIREFMKVFEAFKQNYVKDKEPAGQALYDMMWKPSR